MSEEMEKFFDQFYSASIMKLVLYGPQTLDELENLVSATFSDIPNKNVLIPKTPRDAFDDNQLPRWIEVVPELDLNMLMIMIPVELNVSGTYITPEGLGNVNDIACHFFRYINLLKNTGPQEWYWKEMQQMKEIRNRHPEQVFDLTQVSSLATRLLVS